VAKIAAADAWADRAYILFGDAVAVGLPAEKLFAEVHRSNMKEPDSAGSGKAVKGANYEPPRIADALPDAKD
jgi:predicted HAD superfamily Cof-like phosphohydrolase